LNPSYVKSSVDRSENKRRQNIRLSHNLKRFEVPQNQIKPIGKKTLLLPNPVTIQLEKSNRGANMTPDTFTQSPTRMTSASHLSKSEVNQSCLKRVSFQNDHELPATKTIRGPALRKEEDTIRQIEKFARVINFDDPVFQFISKMAIVQPQTQRQSPTAVITRRGLVDGLMSMKLK
jgi:hypothetical protein